MQGTNPLRIAVLIDHRPNHRGETGGLVGTWEHLSRVAAGRPDIHLTLFFIDDEEKVISKAENVTYVMLPPALGTERFYFLRSIPTHTDLAPFHLSLYKRLKGFDILHTTDAFHAFAKTALWRHRLCKTPLVTSIHTDVIAWARIHTPFILQRLIPLPLLRNCILGRLRLLDRQERSMTKRLGQFLRHCNAVFVSNEKDHQSVQRLSPGTPTYFLRRGIDLELFHPGRADRDRLAAEMGIPPERTLLLFVGRLDPVKGAIVAAEVTKALIEAGRDVHLLAVGDGSQKGQIWELLGERVTLTGNLPHESLGWIYASSDLMLFPSEAEVWPNVVMEARASGLPVVACHKGASHVMIGGGQDGLLLSDRDVNTWTECVKGLLDDLPGLKRMRHRSRELSERDASSWVQVLEEDLMPVWERSASINASIPGPAEMRTAAKLTKIGTSPPKTM